MIYAIQMGNGPVKIGKAKNPRSRLRELSTGSPYVLKLLAAVDWHDSNERLLHQYLRFYRLRGEWFEPSDEVLTVVERMESGSEGFYGLMSEISNDPEAVKLAFGEVTVPQK